MAISKPLHRLLIGFLLCLILPSAWATASPPTQSSDAPYLMAYSDTPTPHFVIEQADGTDSRIFGEGLMPADTNYVAGPGWSPSGKWFAWTADTQYLESNRGSTAYILSADGQTRPTGLDDMGRVAMRWSPNADILLVAGLVNPPVIVYDEEEGYVTTNNADTLTMRMGLFDPATNEFIVVQDIPAPYERIHLLEVRFRIAWHEDGQHGFVQADLENGVTRFYALSVKEEISFRDYDTTTLLRDAIHFYYPQVMLTTRGEIARQPSPDSIDFEDIVTGRPSLHLQILNETIESIEWSDDGEHALLTTSKACDESDCPQYSLWIYNRAENQSHQLLRERTTPFVAYPAPDYSRVITIETRPDGRYAVYIDSLDRTPVELGKVIDIQEYYENDPVVRWTGASRFVMATQREDGGLNTHAAYEIREDTPAKLGEFSAYTYGTIPPIAPNRTVVVFNFDTVTLIDVENGENVILPPDARRYFTNPNGDARWHPTEDWALLEENAAVAGGGAPIYSGVVNADGSVRRPLGGCIAATPICVSWLPPQVDPSTLAPGHDNSPIPLTGHIPVGYWIDEIIWSPDMRQIATAGDFRFNQYSGPFDIWQVSDGTQLTSFDDVKPEETITWTGGQPAITPIVKHPLSAEFGLITVAPDGSQFARYMVDYMTYTVTLELFDPQGNVLVTLQDVLTSDWHATLNYSPDGHYLAVSSAQGPVRLVDTSTGEVVAELPMIWSNAVAFSPDGTQLAVAYGTEIHIYDVEVLLKKSVQQ